MAVTIVVGVVRIAASLSFVWVSKYLVDIATGVRNDSLGPAIGLFLGIMAVQLGVIIFGNWWDSYNQVKAQNLFRKSLFGHVLKSRWDGRERFLSGDTVNRLEEDIRVVSDLICERIPGLAITVVQLLAASAYLLVLAPNLLWVLIILMGAAVLGSKLFFRQIRELMSHIRARESEMQQLMQESLQHRVLVLTLTHVDRVLEKFGWLQADVEDNTRKRLNYNAIARGLMFLGFQAGHAAAFLWGIVGILHGTVTYGTMTAFLQLVPGAAAHRRIRPADPGLHHSPHLRGTADGTAGTGRGAGHGSHPSRRRSRGEVSRVTYRYPGLPGRGSPGTSPAPSPRSDSVPSPALPASGKSTLIRLILGLLKPSEGSVTIGGIPAGSALRSNFMYIPQGSAVKWEAASAKGRPSASPSPVPSSAPAASSSWTRARRPWIPSTEQQLLENLHSRYHGKKTILFISHREAVTQYADHIVTL